MSAPLVKDSGGSDFQLPEPGTYPAVCTWIIGMGPQITSYGPREKLKFRFELPTERVTWEAEGVEQEGPMVMWATYTSSLSDKSFLRRDLEAWRGRPFTSEELASFDLDTVLGAPCLVSITHRKADNGKTYADISSISRLMKGMEPPKPEGDLIGFDPRNFEQKEFDALPEWLQDKIQLGLSEIKAQEELAEKGPPGGPRADQDPGFADDDIPF